jgi:hypothetical protein
MDPVHIRCHKQQSKEPVNLFRQGYITVVDLDDKNKDYLIQSILTGIHSDKNKNREADEGGKHDFKGVKTVGCCDIHLSVCMMNTVKEPEERDSVIDPVPKIHPHIKQNKCNY